MHNIRTRQFGVFRKIQHSLLWLFSPAALLWSFSMNATEPDWDATPIFVDGGAHSAQTTTQLDETLFWIFDSEPNPNPKQCAAAYHYLAADPAASAKLGLVIGELCPLDTKNQEALEHSMGAPTEEQKTEASTSLLHDPMGKGQIPSLHEIYSSLAIYGIIRPQSEPPTTQPSVAEVLPERLQTSGSRQIGSPSNILFVGEGNIREGHRSTTSSQTD